jgi:hypothetical protein
LDWEEVIMDYLELQWKDISPMDDWDKFAGKRDTLDNGQVAEEENANIIPLSGNMDFFRLGVGHLISS